MFNFPPPSPPLPSSNGKDDSRARPAPSSDSGQVQGSSKKARQRERRRETAKGEGGTPRAASSLQQTSPGESHIREGGGKRGAGAAPRATSSLVPPELTDVQSMALTKANLFRTGRLREERARLRVAEAKGDRETVNAATSVIEWWESRDVSDLIEFGLGLLDDSVSASAESATSGGHGAATKAQQAGDGKKSHRRRTSDGGGFQGGEQPAVGGKPADTKKSVGGSSQGGGADAVVEEKPMSVPAAEQEVLFHPPLPPSVSEEEVSELAEKLVGPTSKKEIFMSVWMGLGNPIGGAILTAGFIACLVNPAVGCSIMLAGLGVVLLTSAVKLSGNMQSEEFKKEKGSGTLSVLSAFIGVLPDSILNSGNEVFLGLAGSSVGIFLGWGVGMPVVGVLAGAACLLNPFLAPALFLPFLIGGAAVGGVLIPVVWGSFGNTMKSLSPEAKAERYTEQARSMLESEALSSQKETMYGQNLVRERRIDSNDDGTWNYVASCEVEASEPGEAPGSVEVQKKITSLHLDFIQEVVERAVRSMKETWPKPDPDIAGNALLYPQYYIRLLDFLVTDSDQLDRINNWGELDPRSIEAKRLKAEIDYYFEDYLKFLPRLDQSNPLDEGAIRDVFESDPSAQLYGQIVKRQGLSYWQPTEPGWSP